MLTDCCRERNSGNGFQDIPEPDGAVRALFIITDKFAAIVKHHTRKFTGCILIILQQMKGTDPEKIIVKVLLISIHSYSDI